MSISHARALDTQVRVGLDNPTSPTRRLYIFCTASSFFCRFFSRLTRRRCFRFPPAPSILHQTRQLPCELRAEHASAPDMIRSCLCKSSSPNSAIIQVVDYDAPRCYETCLYPRQWPYCLFVLIPLLEHIHLQALHDRERHPPKNHRGQTRYGRRKPGPDMRQDWRNFGGPWIDALLRSLRSRHFLHAEGFLWPGVSPCTDLVPAARDTPAMTRGLTPTRAAAALEPALPPVFLQVLLEV